MSAYYLIVREDRVEMLTDGAVYREDGTLIDIQCKSLPVGDLPLAITGRGEMAALEAMEAALRVVGASGSVDRVIAYLQAMLGDERRREQLGRYEHELILAGVSDAGTPFAMMYTTHAAYADMHPFTLYDIGPEYGGGPAIDPAKLPFTPDDFVAAGNDAMRRFGADIVEAMRRQKAPNPAKPDLPEIYGIGGHCDLTTVTADGVEIERLRTWPDQIGEKIEPAVAVLVN
ncbi:hypothetical protein [Roseitalea porphyridii]|uniref:Uncharacterized protein n=1 Tax=Roseitalea porphyridii TaxID=1852022 RepID=A0A4P6V0B9_9HYPH|nr:hypothetical protein [Roseitalea porphyridii]QBK30772.1 hypothetical protein E0E05_09310 [Roseitalea porphyridii]